MYFIVQRREVAHFLLPRSPFGGGTGGVSTPPEVGNSPEGGRDAFVRDYCKKYGVDYFKDIVYSSKESSTYQYYLIAAPLFKER